jgi:hypothetical protein
MEWTIPLQNLDTSKINIGAPTQGSKLISILGYSDEDATFNSLSILLPILPVKSYDATTGKLQISLQGGAIAAKLLSFQEMLINSVCANQRTWFPSARPSDKEDIKHGFQPFVEGGCIHLYCPSSSTGISNEIHTYSAKAWSRGAISPSIFSAGKNLRLAIKIQGLSFHQHPMSKAWTGKFRLQHRISAIMAT